jgi:4,5-dihydroxyphthalate decarboxylase
MAELKLRIGVGDSDRMRPLVDGAVRVEGVDAEFSIMPVQALFNRQLTEHTFDCCEFPLGTYMRTLETEAKPYVAIPIFPSRHFRLSCVFINRKSGITQPADLVGRKVGVPVFDMAAAVWVRGIFAEHFALDRVAPIYVSGGLEQPRVGDEHPQIYPAKFRIEHVGRALSEMLDRGEIDALYTARAPSAYFRPNSNVVRLFDDPVKTELAYFRKTGIVPPMHLICLKRSIYERDPSLALRLFDAFAAAQACALDRMRDSSALSVMLPWLYEHLRATEQLLGRDFWSVGFKANKATLAKAIQYMREDELIHAEFAPEDLFPDAAMLAT